MDAYRVIRYPGDEGEGARWACGARRQRGPVEIASRPAPAILRPRRTRLSTVFTVSLSETRRNGSKFHQQ